MSAKKRATPVRSALTEKSTLQELVRDGLGAVGNSDRNYIHQSIRTDFADSLNTDEAMRVGRERQNRWDYLLGFSPSGAVVALEPHSAKEDEISTVIAKRRALLDQIRAELRPGAQIAEWFWVASGKVYFADTERAKRRLDQNGIRFVGKALQRKHMSL